MSVRREFATLSLRERGGTMIRRPTKGFVMDGSKQSGGERITDTLSAFLWDCGWWHTASFHRMLSDRDEWKWRP